ncbi:hypothetical protein AAEO57_14575 [Flavobacterium sp. DGU38]|uniref:Signal peptidase n=1 Tax=Flavobacterium calami TaxID=3139144 RepID=A0ABU9IS19_9FLAO
MKIPGKIAILLLMLFNAVMVFAQPPCPTCPVAPPSVPIDGEFLAVLIAAGFLLGVYTIYIKQTKTKASV